MKENLDEDERIISSLPQVWGIALGFRGFFNKNKEGVIALTNKNLIFVPRYLFITSKEKERYFGNDKAGITQIADYTETDLDEDISENPKSSWKIPLESIIDVRSITARKVNFLRITFTEKDKEKKCDFGISKTVANYPQRQPVEFKNLDWSLWVGLIKSNLKSP